MATTQLAMPERSHPHADSESRGTAEDHRPSARLGELIPEVYDELRRVAAAYLRGERATHTLRPAALVHEAFLRLCNKAGIDWQNPRHVVGIFARVMRQTLTDHAVAPNGLKRGGAEPMAQTLEFYESRNINVGMLNQALETLEALDPRQAQIVELRFFSGLTIEEIAELLRISPATVKREWSFAKVWLRRQLSVDP